MSLSPRISSTVLPFFTSCSRPSRRCFAAGASTPDTGEGRRRRRRVLRVDRLPNNYDVTEFLSTHSAYRIERIDFSPNSVDLRFFRPVDAEERKGRWHKNQRYKDEQMSFVGPSRPVVDVGIIARIGAWHASRRLIIPGEWTVQTLQDLFTPYGAVCYAGVRENRGVVEFLNIADAIKVIDPVVFVYLWFLISTFRRTRLCNSITLCFAEIRTVWGTTPRKVHITGIQRNQVEDHVLTTLRAVKRSTGLSLRHDADKETMVRLLN